MSSGSGADVVNPSGETVRYTELAFRKEVVSAKMFNALIGIKENQKYMTKMLNRLLPTSQSAADKDLLEVLISPMQHDMIHACDIYEDVAIAYRYNRIPKTLPGTMHSKAF